MKIKKIILAIVIITIVTGCSFGGKKDNSSSNASGSNNVSKNENSFVDETLVDSSVIPMDITFKTGVEGFGYYDVLYKKSSDSNDKTKYFFKPGLPFIPTEYIDNNIKPFGKYTITSARTSEQFLNNESNSGGYSYKDGIYSIYFNYYYYTPTSNSLSLTVYEGDSIYYNRTIENEVNELSKVLHNPGHYVGSLSSNLEKNEMTLGKAIQYNNNSYGITDVDLSFWIDLGSKFQKNVYNRTYKGYFQLTHHTGMLFDMQCYAIEDAANPGSVKVPVDKVEEYTNNCAVMFDELFELYGISEQSHKAYDEGTDITDKCVEYLNS